MVQAALMAFAEGQRVAARGHLQPGKQAEYGQFFTPVAAAHLIAAMVRLPSKGTFRVLDPGAGTGILSAALVARLLHECPEVAVHITAIERDATVLPFLAATLHACELAGQGQVSTRVVKADFIIDQLGLDARLDFDTEFDLVIQNPPYGKLGINSESRRALRAAGLDAPNLYAAFLRLSAPLLCDKGQLVAITPRSFFNGPYFSEFRKALLTQITLDKVHIFDSRSTVFADTGVLQENIIFSGIRNGERQIVELSVSHDHTSQISTRRVPYSDVVNPSDQNQFVRLTIDGADTKCVESMMGQPCSLHDLGITVSTGRVVDFRSRNALSESSVVGGFPLIYPGNLRAGKVEWPRAIRKPQWFVPTDPKDSSLLFPPGWYVVIKRFSAKEEKRRIVAATWTPDDHPGYVAFENHLNVLHCAGSGLDEALARGLTSWLNSPEVDRFFRTFSGHTQVNATDLRAMRFPDAISLSEMASISPHRRFDAESKVIAA